MSQGELVAGFKKAGKLSVPTPPQLGSKRAQKGRLLHDFAFKGAKFRCFPADFWALCIGFLKGQSKKGALNPSSSCTGDAVYKVLQQ